MTDERIAEIEQAHGGCDYVGVVQELIAALREARADTRRLDWLDSTEAYIDCAPDDPLPWRCETGDRYHVPIDVWGMNPRAAIDAAMATEQESGRA